MRPLIASPAVFRICRLVNFLMLYVGISLPVQFVSIAQSDLDVSSHEDNLDAVLSVGILTWNGGQTTGIRS